MGIQIKIPGEKIAEFCRRNHIRSLALFGSVLRDDFQPDSNVDVLIEFEEEQEWETEYGRPILDIARQEAIVITA